MIKFLHGAKSILMAAEKLFSAASLLLLLILTLVQIVARNFFETGFPQLEIISRHLVLFIMFMGAALACEGNNHIKIDILCAYLPQQKKNALLRPLFLFSSIITFILAWYSAVFWIDEWTYSGSSQLLSVLLALILPAGFSVLGLHFILLVVLGINSQLQTTSP